MDEPSIAEAEMMNRKVIALVSIILIIGGIIAVLAWQQSTLPKQLTSPLTITDDVDRTVVIEEYPERITIGIS